jgi:hypothetical protein
MLKAQQQWRKGEQEVLTPAALYDQLNEEFNFDHDPAPASYDPKTMDDGLTSEWGQSNFVNPPYKEIQKWMAKAIREKAKGKLSVMLIPFHPAEYREMWNEDITEIRLFTRNIQFQGFSRRHPNGSAIYIFDPTKKKFPKVDGKIYSYHTFASFEK